MKNMFTIENLVKLEFNSPQDAYNQLKAMAVQSGFTLAIRDSNYSHSCRYYCSKGGRIRGKTTNKTDCPFEFRLKAEQNKEGKLITKISEKKICLTHNHELKTGLSLKYQLQFIDGELLLLIENMINSDIPPNKIRKFLYKQGFDNISTLQIRQLQLRKSVADSNIESDDLINYIKKSGGKHKIFSLPQEGVEHRLAILTFQPQEISNLQHYGDILFIDGTQVKLNLRWEVVPITLIDENKNIKCGGILYASIFTEEVIVWLLNCLLDFDFLRKKSKQLLQMKMLAL